MTTETTATDRLLAHYTDSELRHRNLTAADRDTLEAQIDAAPSWQVRLGRTGGDYGYVRALIIAGIATPDERDYLNDFGG